MEQILIYHPNGTTEPINNTGTASVIKQAEHKKVLLGEDVITMTVESAVIRSFAIGDYIKVLGLSKYKINQLPSVTKLAERKYQYDLSFEGLQYDLLRVAYKNTDLSSYNTSADFSLMGNLEMFLNVLINNLSRVFGINTWVLGDYPSETETKNLAFNNENCLAVLQKLCEEFKQQFIFEETPTHNVLHVRTVGTALDYSFKYGQGKGLYKLTRENVDSKNIINKLWAYGSTKNLPAEYKGHSNRLIVGLIEDQPFLDAFSIGRYGVFEGSVIFEDIYPNRTGVVTSVSSENRTQFIDNTLDFDLNEKVGDKSRYLIPGNAPKIIFQTGNLAGYEFEVEKYETPSYKFTLKQIKDPKGIDMPSKTDEAFQINVNDTYIMVDIIMPATYVEAAEAELATKAAEYLNSCSVPIVKYNLELDESYLKSIAGNQNVFEIGDTINIEDEGLEINARIKITDFTRDILRPYRYTLSIQDTPQMSSIRKIILQNKKYINLIKKKGLDSTIKTDTDWRSDTQILSEFPRYLKEVKNLVVGETSEDLTLGNNSSSTQLKGTVGVQNNAGFKADFNVTSLSGNRTVTLPDQDIVINDWNYIMSTPESFPSLSSDYGLTGIKNGVNTVFSTSDNFVEGSTIVYVNGVRQFRGATEDYTESGPNQITFAVAPYADDHLIADFQKS